MVLNGICASKRPVGEDFEYPQRVMADAFHPLANCKPVTPQAYGTCDISALMASIELNGIKGFWRLKSLTGD